MKHWQIVTGGVLSAAWILPALGADAQTPPPQPPAAAWYAAGHVELQVIDTENALTARWQFDRADNGDIGIIKDEQRSAGKIAGTVMSVCDDRALLFKGITPTRPRELAELEQPVLLLQLALKLLARAMPQGPQPLVPGLVEIADAEHPLRVAKGGNVRRDFGAPWQAQIRTSRIGNGDINFEATLTYAGSLQKNSEIKLSGLWRQASAMRAWGNNTALKEYRVYRVEKSVALVGGNAQIEPEVLPQVFDFATLGALRARIERNWDPNPKAAKQLACPL